MRVYTGRRNVYAAIIGMMEKSASEVCMLTTLNDLISLSLYGLDETLSKLHFMGIKVKIITNVTNEKAVKNLTDLMKYAIIRHSDAKIENRLLIVDGKTVLTSLVIDDSAGLDSEIDSCIWTESPHYAQSAKLLFELMWREAQDLSVLLYHFRTGRPIERTLRFNEISEYHHYFCEVLDKAEKEIFMRLKCLEQPYIPANFIQNVKELSSRGVKVRILAYLDEDAFSLDEIFNYADVRHIEGEGVSADFVVADNSEILLCFPHKSKGSDSSLMQGFWSNIQGFAEMLSEIFRNMWNHSISPETRYTSLFFNKLFREALEKLHQVTEKEGWVLNAPAMIISENRLKHTFTLALKEANYPRWKVVVDCFDGTGDLKTKLISLYVKAMDVKADRKILLLPRVDLPSAEELEIAIAYGIQIVGGMEPDKIVAEIKKAIQH